MRYVCVVCGVFFVLTFCAKAELDPADRLIADAAVVLSNNCLAQNPEDETGLLLLQLAAAVHPEHKDLFFLQAFAAAKKKPDPVKTKHTLSDLRRRLRKRAGRLTRQALAEDGSAADVAIYYLNVAMKLNPKDASALARIKQLEALGVKIDEAWENARVQISKLRDEKKPVLKIPELKLDAVDREIAEDAMRVASTVLATNGNDERAVILLRLSLNLNPQDFDALRTLACLEVQIPVEAPKRKGDTKKLLEDMLRRCASLRKRDVSSTGPLRALYAKVVEKFSPHDPDLVRELARIDRGLLKASLDDLLGRHVDKHGFFDASDYTRITEIRSPFFRIRNKSERQRLLRRYAMTKAGQKAVGQSLDWLVKKQTDAGSWDEEDPAVTALSLLCFLANGELPGSKKHGKCIHLAMIYLAKFVNEKWRSVAAAGEDLELTNAMTYQIPIVTIALAESYAMTRIEVLRAPLEFLVDFIIKGQREDGGYDYRYQQGARWDASVSSWNGQALWVAKHADVKHKKLKSSLRDLERFYCKQAFQSSSRSFVYAAGSRGGENQNMTGLGTLMLHLLKTDDKSETVLRKALKTMIKQRTEVLRTALNEPAKWKDHLKRSLYGWFFDTHALFYYREYNRVAWDNWIRMCEKVLLANQERDGYWEGAFDEGLKGRILTTCFCTLQLEAAYRFSPK